MKRLWAPWRMEYVGGQQKPGCLFCRVIEHPDDPDAELVVWRPAGALLMLNKFPYNPGHALVVPVAHVPALENLDDHQTNQSIPALPRPYDVRRAPLRPPVFLCAP